MRIILIRHFEVDFKWKFWYNSDEYDHDRTGYNTAAVVKTKLDFKSVDRLITSTMGRTLETSLHIFGREPDLSVDVLCEVPIKAFVKTKLRLPKIIWDIIGRIQWRLNLGSQPESYAQSKERVYGFLTTLLEEGKDVVIVCHGWIMKIMIARLRTLGFKGPRPIYIRNGLPYEFKRNTGSNAITPPFKQPDPRSEKYQP
jgi:broad specificity phosphatase PhoE